VIVVGGGTPATRAAKAATSSIPIVLVTGSDPVALGLVASLNRPGGNITGVTFITSILAGKRLDLLHQLVMTIGYLSDPRFSTDNAETSDVLTAARTLGRRVIVAEVRSVDDFDAAFAKVVQGGAGQIGAFPLFTSNRDRLVALAMRYKIPAIYQNRDYALDGGLISYGASQAAAFSLGAGYVGRILKGAKPVDLPVQQSTKLELTINLKTAKALDLDVPPMLLAIADEVIE
jgi:putative tryptophan/tyrosine transport system substrate-binding protein